MIQRSKQRYSNMLWNMQSITRHKRSYGHPLHPDLTPDVLTCVLPLGTVSSGRESEVESAHLFLTIIQFFSACHSVHESCQHFTGHSVRQSIKVCLTDKNFVCPKNRAWFGKIIKGGVCVCVCGGGYNKFSIKN